MFSHFSLEERAQGFPVMDVLVLLSDKFLQSKEFDQNAPQIQFIFREWDIPVVQRRRLRTVQPVQKTSHSTVLVQLWWAVVFEAAAWGGGRLLLLSPSRSPALFLLEVLTVLAQDRFQRRLLDLFTLMSTCPAQLRDEATSKPYFWNRRTRATKWKPPPGIRVVWVGEKGSGGEVWYWHKGTRASTCDLPPLPPGRSRGEAWHPSPLLGCHLWQTCSVSACCLIRTLWLLGLVASVSCVLLARQWVQYIRLSSVAFGCYFTHFSVKVGLGS